MSSKDCYILMIYSHVHMQLIDANKSGFDYYMVNASKDT